MPTISRFYGITISMYYDNHGLATGSRACDAQTNSSAPMTRPAYDITHARVVRHGVLELTFADGLQGEVEVLPRMWGPVFEHARTVDGFAQVTVDPEGSTVAWPGDVDLAPDTLYERVRTGVWPI